MIPARAVKQMFCDSQCGCTRVTTCSTDVFLAKVIAGRLGHVLSANNEASYGMSGHAGLSVTFGDEYLASV